MSGCCPIWMILFIFCSKEQAGAGAVWIKAVLDSLGLATNPKKCEWEPSQSVHHLGITVNTAAAAFLKCPVRS